MVALDDIDIARSLGSIDARLANIEDRFRYLPCNSQDAKIEANAREIAKLNVKASVWGALGGALVAAATFFFNDR